MSALELSFWMSLGLLAYVYLGYPAIVWGLSRLRPRPIHRARVTPTITVVIAAYNEEWHIAQKIENCLALAYPPRRLDLIVVSDGSTDRTPAIVAEYASRFPERVRLISLPHRQGKASALNSAVAHATGEVVLLADTRQEFDSNVATALAHNFADPEVGAVSGELVLLSEEGAGPGLGLYWRYEKLIRQAESRCGSSIGYTGAVSAIRRSLFVPLAQDTLVDDLVVPLHVIARHYRVVFEPAAKAFDWVSRVPGREFSRKVRTLAGVLQACAEVRERVGSLSPRIWWQFLSHKVLRLAVPYALVMAFMASMFLQDPFYRAAFWGQATVYGLGVAGWITSRRIEGNRLLSVPSTFLMLNVAAVMGTLHYVIGRHTNLWRRPVLKTRADA